MGVVVGESYCCFIPINEQGNNTRRTRNFKAISPSGRLYFGRNVRSFAKRYNISSLDNIYACLNGRRKTHKKWRFIDIGVNK
jgi:Mor family transcriptional regulator